MLNDRIVPRRWPRVPCLAFCTNIMLMGTCTKRTRADAPYWMLTGNYTHVTPKLIKKYFYVVIWHSLFTESNDAIYPFVFPGTLNATL